MSDRVGTVVELWRYPVKSMQGERVDAAVAGERGLAGDRAWAVVDAETGHVVSAKRPKLWLTMLECDAACAEEPQADGPAAPVRITLPDGREVHSDDPERDRLLSEALGRKVTLESRMPDDATYELRAADAEGLDVPDPERLTETRVGVVAPPGTFFDTSTLHVLATETLEALAGMHPDGQWDMRRFRPNVLVTLDDPPAEGFAENAWVGHSLRFGEVTEAAVLVPMPRCVMTTLPQGDLPRDPLILRTLAERNRQELGEHGSFACVGAMVNVSVPGRVAAGDEVSVRPQ